MKFDINPKTTDSEIIECSRHICAWLRYKEKPIDISLLALANGEIIKK